MASLGKLAGVELLTVPYKGTPAIVPDLIGGLLDATAIDPGMAASFVKSGQLRALAVSSLKRNPLTPDWPAVSEHCRATTFLSGRHWWAPRACPAIRSMPCRVRLTREANIQPE